MYARNQQLYGQGRSKHNNCVYTQFNWISGNTYSSIRRLWILEVRADLLVNCEVLHPGSDNVLTVSVCLKPSSMYKIRYTIIKYSERGIIHVLYMQRFTRSFFFLERYDIPRNDSRVHIYDISCVNMDKRRYHRWPNIEKIK